MIKINSIDELGLYLNKLPLEVIKDIDKRITDWLASGGKENDPYIKQQLRFASNFLNIYN